MVNFTAAEWHERYLQQARWTQDLRDYLFKRRVDFSPARSSKVWNWRPALGACKNRTQALIYGLDVNPRISICRECCACALLSQGDGRAAFPRGFFDLTFCHFLLLWVSKPEQIVAEMRRVTRPGGSVIALAEPDYGGGIDYPEELAELGRRQAAAAREPGRRPEDGTPPGAGFPQHRTAGC